MGIDCSLCVGVIKHRNGKITISKRNGDCLARILLNLIPALPRCCFLPLPNAYLASPFSYAHVCNLQALQHVNSRLRDLYPEEQDLFDIVLMTNNHAQVGVRLINSVNHYGK